MKKKLMCFKLLGFMALLAITTPEVWAGTKLAWDSDVAGCRIYCRTEGQVMDFSKPPVYDGTEKQIDLSVIAKDLPAGGLYFVARAYVIDGDGQIIESPNSNEVYVENGDADNDNLPQLEEQYYKTDPSLADTDGDGINDGAEIVLGTNPRIWGYQYWFTLNNYFYGVKKYSNYLMLYIVHLFGENINQENILIGNQGDEIISIKDHGDSDGDGVIEIEITFAGAEGNYTEIRNAINGELIAPVSIYCDLNYSDFSLVQINGQDTILLYGRCDSTGEAFIKLIDPLTEVEKSIKVGYGESINASVTPDQNGDDKNDLFISIETGGKGIAFKKNNE